jgi:hypothetical protein
VVSREGARLIDLGLGPATLAFVGAGAVEDHALIDRVLGLAGAEGFARGWLEARGLGAAAQALGRFEAARARSAPGAPRQGAVA